MSALQIFHCGQNTPEWDALRAVLPTASCMATVMASGRTKGSPSEGRQKYMDRIIAARRSAPPGETYSNAAMERGHAMEDEARQTYSLISGNPVERAGFMQRTFPWGVIGASLDSTVNDNGQVEIKTAKPEIQIPRVFEGVVPSEHAIQLETQLLVSGRDWCDFVSYWPSLPTLIVRVYPNPELRARILVAAQDFWSELLQREARLEAA